MVKKLAILTASVLITLGYAGSASGGETFNCTQKAGEAGGEAAKKCFDLLKQSGNPTKHPKFLRAYFDHHCPAKSGDEEGRMTCKSINKIIKKG